MPITDEQIAKLKAEHGDDIHLLENPPTGDEIVCKAPSDGEYKRWKAGLGTTALERIAASRTFVVGCLVFPGKAEWEAMLAARPGLAETFAGELGEIAGISNRATHRKL